jgi:hypothetical protein
LRRAPRADTQAQSLSIAAHRDALVDLKVPITITDEFTDGVVTARAWLNLASGAIDGVQYVDYDSEALGLPCERDDYEFTSGTLSNEGKDVEFGVELNRTTGQYSVSPSELLEIKVRAAALFAGVTGRQLLDKASGTGSSGAAPSGAGNTKRRLH